MRRVTLRSIWEHKRRLISTVVAIVLGVAFMSGTLVFADTIDKVFDDLFAEVNEGIDVQVQGEQLFDGGFGPGPTPRQDLPLPIVDLVEEVDGVARAVPFIQTLGFGSANRILGPDGEALGSTQGPPTLLESWIPDDVISPYRLADGRGPEADDEVALNVGAVEDAALEIGDTVTALTQLGRTTYEVVGTFTFGTAESSAGAISAGFTLAEAQRIAGLDGATQVVLVAGDGSVDDATLAQRVSAALPPGAEAITGAEAAAQTASDVQGGFEFFRILLIVFGVIAVVVGAFIIFNTFSILVAQRTREMALLRAIGASRRQVLGSVILEAAVIGLLSAVLGLLAGVALAVAVTAGFSAAGADLPTASLVISPQTVVVAFVVGLGVTLAASILPAVQATRVAPLAALREVAIDRAAASKIRIIVGALVLVLGAFNLSAAFRVGGSDALPVVGFGALITIVGAIVIGPALADPSVRVLGSWLPAVRGIRGRLAVENAARSPKRTSATASALLIGVALIGFITIFAASASASIEAEVERGFTGDLVIQAESGFGPPTGFSPAVVDEAAAVEGVAFISRVAFLGAQITPAGQEPLTAFVSAFDPDTALQIFEPRMAEGDLSTLGPDGIVVDVDIAEERGLTVGDTVSVLAPGGATAELTIDSISDDITLIGFWAIDNATYAELTTERQVVQAIVKVDGGADVDTVRQRIETAIADVPGLNVLDRDAFIGDLTSQITTFLTLIYALLLLSVIIAMIGIANTLSLSIHERTRELGLLRAVGMSRSQLRSSIRWEAVIISILGTAVGLAIGLVVSWALVTALESFGLTVFRVPVQSIAFVVIGAAVLGVFASIRPARRAAKLDILDAIATE